MIVAHVAGIPVEEWLVPVAASGPGLALVLGQVLRRQRRRFPSGTMPRRD